MTRKVISILCYAMSGFFFYVTSVIGFVHPLSAAAKWAIMGAFLLPALIFLGGGLASSRDRRWKRDIGIVLASSAALSTFIVLSMACIFMEPEFQKLVPPAQIAFFGDYVTGVVWIGLLAGLGGVAMYAGRERRADD